MPWLTRSLKQRSASQSQGDLTAITMNQTSSSSRVLEWQERDPTHPWNWPLPRRILLTVLVSLITINVTLASSAPSSSTDELMSHFGVSEEVVDLVTSLFLVGYIAGPILWSTLSEVYGRRWILVISQLASAIFVLGQIFAGNSFACLLVTRFLSGFCASAPLTIGGGIVADMYAPLARGYASTVFSAAVAFGPCMGPIAGSYLTAAYGWQSVFDFLFCLSLAIWLATCIFLPETFPPVLLAKKAVRMRRDLRKSQSSIAMTATMEAQGEEDATDKDVYAPHELQDRSLRTIATRTLFRPFEMLAKEPILVLTTIYLSLVYGLLYALLEAYPIIFSDTHGLPATSSSLIFLGTGLGSIVAACIYMPMLRKYRRLVPLWEGTPPPEERLVGAYVGAILLVVGCFWLGWAGQYASVPWEVAGAATIILGTSFNLLFFSFFAYLLDTYLDYASSALAANTIFRSIFAATFPLFTTQMFNALGIGWACSLIGFFAVAFAPMPFLFAKYGVVIREKSRFAPAPDLKVRARRPDLRTNKKAIVA